jgi:hypothetical protein
MEYISEPTLQDVLAERGVLPWSEVVGLGLQICESCSRTARSSLDGLSEGERTGKRPVANDRPKQVPSTRYRRM